MRQVKTGHREITRVLLLVIIAGTLISVGGGLIFWQIKIGLGEQFASMFLVGVVLFFAIIATISLVNWSNNSSNEYLIDGIIGVLSANAETSKHSSRVDAVQAKTTHLMAQMYRDGAKQGHQLGRSREVYLRQQDQIADQSQQQLPAEIEVVQGGIDDGINWGGWLEEEPAYQDGGAMNSWER